MLAPLNFLFGIALLFAGRKLFWLFVAISGFVAGVQLAQRYWQGPEWIAILVGLAVGVLFALLAVFLRVVAISIAAFLAGGSILVNIAGLLGIDIGAFTWIVYVVGGILGLILVSLLFDWALITLSSLAGAALILESVRFAPAFTTIGFVLLVLLGIVFQGAALRQEAVSD
jgi:hypothetical protein